MLSKFFKKLTKRYDHKTHIDLDFIKDDIDIIFNIGAKYRIKNSIDKILVEKFSKSLFILVEANQDEIAEIEENYKKFNINFELYNYCLSNKSKEVDFYIRGGKSSYFKSL